MDVQSIEACVVEGNLGNHTTLHLEALIEEEDKIFDKQDENQPIEVYIKQNDKKETIFCGIITKSRVTIQSQMKYLQLTAKSYSYLLDIHKHSRSFQDITMTYSVLIKKVLAPYGAKIAVGFEDQVIGELIVQYKETDWEFLTRVLSQVEATLTPEAQQPGILLYAGVPKLENHKIDYKVLQIKKDLDTYYYLKANEQKVNDIYYMKYWIESTQMQKIFDRIAVASQWFTVRSYTYVFNRSDMKAVYQLQKALGMKRKKRYPMHLIGVALEGTIIGIDKSKVQVHLEIDEVSNKQRSFWFPYSTLSASSDGSGWYCMPEKGDFVRVYFPSKYINEAIALSAVSKYKAPKGGGVDRMQDPNTKFLSTRHNKEVVLSPEGIKIACDGEAAVITVMQDGTISLSAQNGITVIAKENIEIVSENEIMMHAKESFVAVCEQGGAVVLTDAGKAEFSGTEVKVN